MKQQLFDQSARIFSKYDSGMEETLYLQSIPGLWESIEKASATPLSECIPLEEFKW